MTVFGKEGGEIGGRPRKGVGPGDAAGVEPQPLRLGAEFF
jgi:hypothetical protein